MIRQGTVADNTPKIVASSPTCCAGYNCAPHGSNLWHKTRSLRNPVSARRWRHGRGVPRPGHRLGRDVAIKVLPEALARDADRLRRFEQEARTIAALSHPKILEIHDIGTQNGAPFLVSELLEGQTLREKFEAGPLPVRRAIEYALGMAQGLAAAHEKGIVHRDLKPENVFITKDGRVKVLDFGLAKLVSPEESHETEVTLTSPATLPGMVMGTVGCMSPEQVRGDPTDARSDIFSFGAVL
jgi:eukaryotic-like serine/threonine-protein kinase